MSITQYFVFVLNFTCKYFSLQTIFLVLGVYSYTIQSSPQDDAVPDVDGGVNLQAPDEPVQHPQGAPEVPDGGDIIAPQGAPEVPPVASAGSSVIIVHVFLFCFSFNIG
jgi:hypothetical protein